MYFYLKSGQISFISFGNVLRFIRAYDYKWNKISYLLFDEDTIIASFGDTLPQMIYFECPL